ncbi:MAG: redoxin domain-containing protein [Rubrobacter sp.]
MEVLVAAEVGEKAPGFTLPADDWENTVSLEEYTKRGPVALFFYPGDWSSVCTHQMGELQAELGRFEERGAAVLAVSADSPRSHRAFAADRGIELPLLADFNKRVIEDYGVRREAGFPDRAYFIIDREGIVRVRRVESSTRDQPDVAAVLEDLDKAL